MDKSLEILTVEDVCEALGVGRNTVGRLIKNGQLKAFKVGSRVYKIPKVSLDDYILTQAGLKIG